MFALLIPIIVQLIAELPNLIQMAEKAFSGAPGSGAAKKDFVVSAATDALNIYQGLAPHHLSTDQVGAITGSIGPVVDGVVGVLNNAKVLLHTAPAVPPPADVAKP